MTDQHLDTGFGDAGLGGASEGEEPTAHADVVVLPIERRLRLVADGREWIVGRLRAGLRLGRDVTNDVVVGDEFVSRTHAVIRHRRGQFYLLDTSRNGTLVGSVGSMSARVRGERVPLGGTGHIRLGHRESRELWFHVEALSSDGRSWRAVAPSPAGEIDAASGETILRREGEYWTIAHDGLLCRLKDARGLHYIAYLVAHPGCELHAVDLARTCSDGPEADTPGRAPTGLAVQTSGGDDALLDPHAKRAYRRRLVEIGEALAEAARGSDAARIEALKAERDFLADQLVAAVGLGGRDRTMANDAERARVSVTIAIRSVVKKLQEALPDLGWHLASRIRTGRFCSYEPDVSNPVRWIF
jgi:hypothetical protein